MTMSIRRILAITVFAAAAVVLSPRELVAQVQYYYDNNGATAGFGNAGSTWGTNNVVSTNAAGTSAPANTLTTTADTLNLGTSADGLGAGTITVVAGGRSIGSIVRGSASNSGIININSSTITFAAAGSIINNATGTTLGIGSVIAGGGTSMAFTNATVNSTANTYAGVTILNGTHRILGIADGGANSSLGSSSSAASNLVFNDGAILRYDGTSGTQSTNRNFTMNGTSAEIYVRDDGNLTWNGTASFGTPNQAATLRLNSSNAVAGNGTFNGVLADNGTGQLSLRKVGSSTTTQSVWRLGGANTFTGSTAITGGILVLGNTNALQNSYIDTTATASGTTTTGLRTTGTVLNLGGLSGNKDLASIYTTTTGGYTSVTSLTLNVAAANNLSYSGNITNGASGMSLTKSGDGTQILSGTNTYNGTTNINAGTLSVTGSLAAGSTVTVGVNGTLGGNGTINGATTILGAHTPGNSPGVQAFASDLSYSGGNSTVTWELIGNTTTNTGNTTYDQIIVGADLDFADDTALNLSFNGTGSTVSWNDNFWASNQTWTLYDVAGATTGSGNFTVNPASWLDSNSLALGSSIRAGSTFTVSQSTNDILINYVAVPEPATIALLGAGVALLGFRLVRRGKV